MHHLEACDLQEKMIFDSGLRVRTVSVCCGFRRGRISTGSIRGMMGQCLQRDLAELYKVLASHDTSDWPPYWSDPFWIRSIQNVRTRRRAIKIISFLKVARFQMVHLHLPRRVLKLIRQLRMLLAPYWTRGFRWSAPKWCPSAVICHRNRFNDTTLSQLRERSNSNTSLQNLFSTSVQLWHYSHWSKTHVAFPFQASNQRTQFCYQLHTQSGSYADLTRSDSTSSFTAKAQQLGAPAPQRKVPGQEPTQGKSLFTSLLSRSTDSSLCNLTKDDQSMIKVCHHLLSKPPGLNQPETKLSLFIHVIYLAIYSQIIILIIIIIC